MASPATDIGSVPGRLSLGRGTAVVGLQWGDEGKGKVVDLIAPSFDAIVRYNGGANAGHSVVVGGERYALHLVPSGILYPGKRVVIANGVAVDPEVLVGEVDGLESRGVDTSGLVLSDRAHVVMPYHKAEDEIREKILSEQGDASIGTTRRGIGPCYADKAQRATAVRVSDLLHPEDLGPKLTRICRFKNAMFGGVTPEAPRFDPDQLLEWAVQLGGRLAGCISDTTYLLHDMSEAGGRMLFEGANAALLDVDHGTHPFVTSSSTTALGIPSGTGLPGRCVTDVVGVMKAYSTRVGNGPMPTELTDEIGDGIRHRGREFGTTTGRPRRVGWLDLVAVRYGAMINGATGLALTLLDVLSGLDSIKVCVAYRTASGRTDRFVPDGRALADAEPIYETLPGFEGDVSGVRGRGDLPPGAQEYVRFIEEYVGVGVKVIGVGPERSQVIVSGPSVAGGA